MTTPAPPIPVPAIVAKAVGIAECRLVPHQACSLVPKGCSVVAYEDRSAVVVCTVKGLKWRLVRNHAGAWRAGLIAAPTPDARPKPGSGVA